MKRTYGPAVWMAIYGRPTPPKNSLFGASYWQAMKCYRERISDPDAIPGTALGQFIHDQDVDGKQIAADRLDEKRLADAEWGKKDGRRTRLLDRVGHLRRKMKRGHG